MCLPYDIGSVDDHLLIIVMSEIVNLTEISVFLKHSELSPPRSHEISELWHWGNIKFPLKYVLQLELIWEKSSFVRLNYTQGAKFNCRWG